MRRCCCGILGVVLMGGAALLGQEPAQTPTLADVSWIAGVWTAPKSKGAWEEHWSAPRDGAMMGMFRLKQTTGMLYEFLLIEEAKDGVWMRLRHYRGKMLDIDKEPLRLKLVSAAGKKLVFENPDHEKPKRIIYAWEPPNVMNATIETQRDGKPTSFTLKFVRGGEQ